MYLQTSKETLFWFLDLNVHYPRRNGVSLREGKVIPQRTGPERKINLKILPGYSSRQEPKCWKCYQFFVMHGEKIRGHFRPSILTICACKHWMGNPRIRRWNERPLFGVRKSEVNRSVLGEPVVVYHTINAGGFLRKVHVL